MAYIQNIYYLCNKENEKLIEFDLQFSPHYLIIPTSTILREALIPDFLKGSRENERLGYYLQSLILDLGAGMELDEVIIEKLGLGSKIHSYGRLAGLEWIVTLLETHYKDMEREFYVTPKDPTLIFFPSMYGWDRILIDKPVIWEEI